MKYHPVPCIRSLAIPIRIVFTIAIALIMIGCSSPLSSAGTNSPTVSIQNNVTVTRDPQSLDLTISVTYTVTYPSDLYASTLNGVPTLTCNLSGYPSTGPRSLPGNPVNITGTTSAPQTGTATISATGEENHFINGTWSVSCTLAGIKDPVTSNLVSVNIPAYSASTVCGQGNSTDPTAIITNAQTTSSVDANYNPTNPTTTLQINQPIYLTVNLQPPTGGGYAFAKWYLNNSVYQQEDILQVDACTTHAASAPVTYTQAGQGLVEAYWCTQSDCSDAQLATSVTFTVN